MRCWDALRPGGRLVANAVTLESEQLLVAARARHGGELVRLEVSHAEPLGRLQRVARRSCRSCSGAPRKEPA